MITQQYGFYHILAFVMQLPIRRNPIGEIPLRNPEM